MGDQLPPRRIGRLPSGTQAQITSSIQITSLTDVVLELVKNSLDARCRHIEIRLDLARGYCSVLDDGVGIEREEFLEEGGGLAKLYYTSKLDNYSLQYGRYGRFLASLSGVSLLAITSSTRSSLVEHKIVLRDGNRIATDLDIAGSEELGSRSSGTKVVVYNLFGRMPVRIKHRSMRLGNRNQLDKDFATIKKALLGLLLASPIPCSLDVRETSSNHQYTFRETQEVLESDDSSSLNVDRVKAILFEAGFLEAGFGRWETVSGRTEGLNNIRVRAAFRLQPLPTKEFQFMSIGIRPIHNRILQNVVNSIFDASSFGTNEEFEARNDELDSGEKGRTSKSRGRQPRRPVATAKSVDRWPVFYIRIDLSNSDVTTMELMDSTREGENQIQLITSILSTIVLEFLELNGFWIGRYSKTKKRERDQQPREDIERVQTVAQPAGYGFDNWSRMKSSQSFLKDDVKSGLPFLTKSKSPHTTSFISTEKQRSPRPAPAGPSAGSSPGVDGVTKWTDPCTRRILLLNARTGMVLSGQKSDPDQAGHRLVQKGNEDQFIMRRNSVRFRGVKETATRLANRPVLLTPTETPILSTTLNIQLGAAFNHVELPHCCSVGGCASLQIATSANGEAALDSRITKEGLKVASVIGQVDGKFILASLSHQRACGSASETILVLIDQHAADERVKTEELYSQICHDTSVKLASPIIFEVDSAEADLFRGYRDYFSSWKICLDICGESHEDRPRVRVISLPHLIAERCRIEPRLIIELLRREIWKRHEAGGSMSTSVSGDWLSRIIDCPQGVLDMLNSRACRSAIMFNDMLTRGQCRGLVRQLSQCFFPFQCAHGRPSMTVVVKLEELAKATRKMDGVAPTFGQSWRAWMVS